MQKMEVSKLSKFKLRLQTLTTEVRALREKQGVSSDQLHNQFQKWKQDEEGFCRKINELEAELGSSIELRQQLERKVQYLEDENQLLQSKHKELKDTINSILHAKEGFVKAYQESTCEMKRAIESRDRKIGILCERINGHILLLESIQKEASSVKQVVDNVQLVVDEKEETVAHLKDKVCEVERSLIEEVEAKLISKEHELARKDRVIVEIQTQLATAKLNDQCPLKIQELQEAVLMKEGIIETLISENKALRSELGMLEVSFKMIMDEEDTQEKDSEVGRMNESCGHQRTDSPSHIAIHHTKVHSCVSEDNCIQQPDSECSTTQTGTS